MVFRFIDLEDLPDGWERKTLLIIGVVFIVTVIYALHPFQASAPNNTSNATTPQTTTYAPLNQPQINDTSNNSSTSNSTNLTVDQAKNIAQQSYPGFTAGQPVQGSVTVNSTNHNVWIIPLSGVVGPKPYI